MKVLFLMSFFLLNAVPNLMANEKGNGGNGLLLNGTPVVLDLVEAGVDTTPYFDPDVAINPLLLERVKANIPQFPELHKRMAQKLSEIESVSSQMAWALVESFRLFNIRVVNETLVNIHDDDSVLDYDPKILIQLAIRRGTSIFLNGKWWPKMSVDQKIALLFHEMVYSFQNVKEIRKFAGYDSAGNPIFKKEDGQDSTTARAITGYLFTQGLNDQGVLGLKRVLSGENTLVYVVQNFGKNHSPVIKKVEPSALSTKMLPNSFVVYEGNGKYYEVLKDTNEAIIADLCTKAVKLKDSYERYYMYYSFKIYARDDAKLGLDTTYDYKVYIDDVGYQGCIDIMKEYQGKLPK